MENYFEPQMTRAEINQISALGLAHCGDAVFELLVRTWLCAHGGVKAKDLHRATVAYVSAPAQAERMERLMPHLTEEERMAVPYVLLANQFVCVAWFSEQDKYKEIFETNKRMTAWLVEKFRELNRLSGE